MRCATTWTFACLGSHPDLAFPAGKQIHFWDKHYPNGTDWYRSLFDPESPVAEGEITPAYAVLDPGRVAEFARLEPDLRVFFVVRHPIDRAWSSVRLHVRRNEIDPAELPAEWFRERITGPGVIKRNRYADTVATWGEHFGEEQLLVLPYDLAVADPARFLARIAEHIGVSSVPFAEPTQAIAGEIAKMRNVGYELALPDDLRALAAKAYAADIDWYDTHVASVTDRTL